MVQKKNTFLLFVSFVLLWMVASNLYELYERRQGNNMELESIAGHALYMILSNYDEIVGNHNGPLTIESVAGMNRRLAAIEAYSDTIDRATHTNLLNPIANNMLEITEGLQRSYKEHNGFTETDRANYSALKNASTALIPLIYKIYYTAGSEEGGKASLTIKQYEGIVELNRSLSEQLSGSSSPQ
ncbi:hypothetical protein [Paenibacillus tyrfis]|uniref:hypothetical protein n=1 Tax=Paenibacillus tyrfis TaxID=1501230 RepID=UPI0024923011|nr:hypothetical protein [Paenibacillus tyrfis]